MKKRICDYCRQIEKENRVKIIFAIESGSRLWRISSQDSDYDVRFVFVQPLERYVSLQYEKAMELVINKEFGKIDLSGFDIFKFCRLLLKSNPSIIEWMQSDILYYGKKPEGLETIALSQFNPSALFYHYQSMCKQNYEKYLASKKEITYKKYLYALRGLVNAKLVESTGKLPPISFLAGLEESKGILPPDIITELKETIQLKKKRKEKETIKNIVAYNQFIEDFLREKGGIRINGKSPSQKMIDSELRKIVLRKGAK